jgi:hypothetical protein
MQIFAGLVLNCAVFGSLMRPLELATRPAATKASEAAGGNRDEPTIDLKNPGGPQLKRFSSAVVTHA